MLGRQLATVPGIVNRLAKGRLQLVLLLTLASASLSLQASETDSGQGDLRPLNTAAWNQATARHLLERAGFGGTPAEVKALASMSLTQAVNHLVNSSTLDADLMAFDHSGVFDPGLDPFPPSRPATTALASKNGEALGVKVKASGNRPLQPVVNQFFYWLRASRLETDRVAYWWAQRMLTSPAPLKEKMALFWHGHFATNEDKVRDYRKMLKQLELFQTEGLGNFADLLLAVAQDPAMLAFLDAGVNVKGSPNENFAREIMELFSMGVGNYSETDIREAARAFTGWNFEGLQFVVNEDQHDADNKEFLGQTGPFDGEAVIRIILDQDVTPVFIASKLYRYFVREDLDPALAAQLGKALKGYDYQLQPFMTMLFQSRDFYSPASVATRIKPPVELVISTYRKLGIESLPGTPDFNYLTGSLGQHLLHPPTVAGWSQGNAWITPGLLIDRGNFALDLMFPDVSFIPLDRYPSYGGGGEILAVHERIRDGADITSATMPANPAISSDMMAASNALADRDEAFNTRYGSYRGWQMAIERVKPIPRTIARINLSEMVLSAGLETTDAVVDYLGDRFLSVKLEAATRQVLIEYLTTVLGTDDIHVASSYMEDPLRELLHLLLSRPEYQLG
ncbi:MAG: DUF1800 domain-containing protein [Proteobacteria bacterium]|nr:DUF1800 domain-containing protein [Pseudomonadota bacterium]